MTIPKPVSAQTIQVAAFNGALDVVKSLVEAQPNSVKSIDEDQRTALHWAASGKHIQVVEYLVTNGSDVNAQDDAKWTPLMIAASVGAGPIVDYLLLNGADVNLANENKQTPIFYAASKGWLDVCSLLINNGARINARDGLNQTPLHRACARGNIAVVRRFLEQPNIKLDFEDKSGNTVLHVAVDNGHAEIAVLLVEAGAELDVENCEKQKPLDLAPDKNVRSFLERAWVEVLAGGPPGVNQTQVDIDVLNVNATAFALPRCAQTCLSLAYGGLASELQTGFPNIPDIIVCLQRDPLLPAIRSCAQTQCPTSDVSAALTGLQAYDQACRTLWIDDKVVDPVQTLNSLPACVQTCYPSPFTFQNTCNSTFISLVDSCIKNTEPCGGGANATDA
ncbi:UNVERIFIED_CONTAM: hypothetical protein HDU68_002258, partial [Siphonaria sp. JEL0065]